MSNQSEYDFDPLRPKLLSVSDPSWVCTNTHKPSLLGVLQWNLYLIQDIPLELVSPNSFLNQYAMGVFDQRWKPFQLLFKTPRSL